MMKNKLPSMAAESAMCICTKDNTNAQWLIDTPGGTSSAPFAELHLRAYHNLIV